MREHWVSSLLTSFALLSLALLPPILLGIVSVTMQPELGYTDTQLGLAISSFYVVTSIVSPFGGHIADRIGWPLAAIIGSMFSACSLLFTAVFAHSVSGLVIGLVIGGFGFGIGSPTSNLILVADVPANRRGQSFGIKQSAPPAIGLFGGMAIPLIAIPFGWRAVFVSAACLAPLVIAIALPRLFSNRRLKAMLGTERTTARPVPPRRMSLTALIAVCGLGTFGVASLTAFAGLSIKQTGVPVSLTGVVIAFSSAVGLASRIVAGWWLDRRPITTLWPVLIMMVGSGVGLLFLATGHPVLSVVGTTISFVCSWGWPPLVLLLIVNNWAEQPARATGFLQIGTGIGSASGPLMFGILSTAFGYAAGWLTLVGVTSVAAVLVFVLQTRFDRAGAREQTSTSSPIGATP